MRLGQCDAEQRRRRRSDFLGLVFMGKQGYHYKSTPAAPAMYRLIQKTWGTGCPLPMSQCGNPKMEDQFLQLVQALELLGWNAACGPIQCAHPEAHMLNVVSPPGTRGCRAGAASSRSSDMYEGQRDCFPGLDQRTKGLRPRPGQGSVCSGPVPLLRAGAPAAIQRSPPYCQGSSQPLRQARRLPRSPWPWRPGAGWGFMVAPPDASPHPPAA